MATAFCDLKPCAKFQELLNHFKIDRVIVEDRPAVVISALTNTVVPEVEGVTLYYCPFCGTRMVGSVFLGEED